MLRFNVKTPEFPENERARQDALNSLNILDTPAEERFDRLTRLARRMFNVPIAVVSLIDYNRQWFKSCFGLPVCETGRDVSFCGHAILGDDIFVIKDASKDERFADNPLVVNDPKIRFYAGCPLVSSEGYKLGTFCIIDPVARDFTQEDRNTLIDIADLAQRELEAVQLATLDELTEISNRRGFIILATKALKLASRERKQLSLLFLDLNDFKAINDTYGHAEGDEALIAFSKLLEKTFRESDTFARIGGDEFVVVQSFSDKSESMASVKRMKDALDKYNRESGKPYELSFSEGIVTVSPENTLSIEELLNKADLAMYESKKLSRVD